jgi:Nif-specific regulatory protein
MTVKPLNDVHLLNDIAKGLAESLDLQQTLRAILKSLDTHLKLQRGTITLLNPDTETINIEIAHGLSEKSLKLGTYKIGEGITGTVVRPAKPFSAGYIQGQALSTRPNTEIRTG